MIASVLVVFALVNFSNQQTVDQLIEGYSQVVATFKPDCVAASGADPDVIDQEIRNSKFAEDQATKCFWGCFYKKLNLISENDEVLEDNIKKYIGVADKDAAEKIFHKCVHFRGSDYCETATGISRCVSTSSKALLEN
ncbi:hypothetical protein ILUMI_02294 [Ignelater luminosus]|uniref:Uncharacterized protein n=1 Tax=Ignelater luminosus TaxID=2038154 RepID=A0A8K0DIE1_IGNLU|nr:hypothetical protein ILUMI_02294 [Ignelater luminosus]